MTTYPLIIKIKDHIPGFYSTDEPFAALWSFWWLKYSWLKGLAGWDYSTLAVPFGINFVRFSIFPIWEFINKWLAIFTNNVFPYNLEVLGSFLLAGILMYHLVLFLTKNRLCGIFSGVIYAFCPYHFVRAWQHLGLAQIQWMPLYILSLFMLSKNLKIKNMIFSAFCFYLVLSFDLYYAYFMFIVTIVFIVYLLLSVKPEVAYCLRALKMFLLMSIVLMIISLPNLYAIYKVTMNIKTVGLKAEYSLVRPFQDLFTQSARPLSYLLPASVHPVFGKFTEMFVGSQLYGASLTEHMLYLGWIPLVLGFMAFKKWVKNRKLCPAGNKSSSMEAPDFYIGFFVMLAFVGWWFSQPPWWQIGPVKIYMPSFFMYKIIPSIRAYCRFGILVMLAIAVLAGFGLMYLLERYKGLKTKTAVTALFCGLVLFEFWTYPPYKIIDVSAVPAVYGWLKIQPDDTVIAEYPLETEGANLMYMFYQTRHEKKIINGTVPGTYANRLTKTITNLSQPHTAGVLRWMGARYVLVHREEYLNTELTSAKEELERIPNNKGLKFIRSFPKEECLQDNAVCTKKTGPIDVYEVIASPVPPKVEGR